MAIATIADTTHMLFCSSAVPATGVNLAHISYPALSPSASVAIMAAWDDIAENRDDASAGTRQIRVEGLVPLDDESWGVTLRPGNFYIREAAAARLASGMALPAWVVTTDLDSVDDLYWEYSVGYEQARVVSPALADATPSDPYVAVGSAFGTAIAMPVDVATALGDNLYQLHYTPLRTDANAPALQPYIDDVPVGDPIACDVVDAVRGIVRPLDTLPLGATMHGRYVGTRSSYTFTGHWTPDATTFYALDLNPMPHHWCVSAPRPLLYLTTIGGAYVVNEAGAYLTLASQAGDLLHPSRDLIQYNGCVVTLDPVRCWRIAESGAVTCIGTTTRPTTVAWHTMLDDDAAPERRALVLARCYVRAPMVTSQLTLHDTRLPGGGLARRADVAAYPETRAYFDLEHLDGDVTIDNGVAVVVIARRIIDRLGEEAVRAVIESSLAAGVAYILEVHDE